MALATLTHHSHGLVISPTPVNRIKPLRNTSTKTRIRPIHHAPRRHMLHGIEMQIIHMTRIIPLIADCMFPETPLPDTPLTTRRPNKRTPFSLRKLSREPRLDPPPPHAESENPRWRGPDAMRVHRRY